MSILLQEVDRMTQLGDGERFSRVGMNHAVALHLEPLCGKILEVSGVGEVHKDLVVKLSHVVHRLIERHVERFTPPHRVVKSDPNKKRGFTNAMSGHDDSDVSTTKAAVDRVLE